MKKIYFDNSATTPLAEELRDLILNSYLEDFANPSSIHSLGRAVKKKINAARSSIAAVLNAEAEEIKFLSGATEANNTVFNLLNYDLIITSPSEHASVIEAAKASSKPIIWLNLNKEGYIDLAELEKHLSENQGKLILVSIMHANSEIATVQDLKSIGHLCKRYSAIFHSDCVQSLSKLKIDVKDFNLDLVSASAHKIHGAKGVGFLYIKRAVERMHKFRPLIVGGGQEHDFRAGTENVTGIIAFAKALEISLRPENINKVKELRAKLWLGLKDLKGAVLNGPLDLEKRLINNLNISFMDLKYTSEQLVLQLDLKGVCVSSGSACTSNKKLSSEESFIESSYVLRACRIDEEISRRAIRISLSWMNSEAELEKMIEIIKKLV